MTTTITTRSKPAAAQLSDASRKAPRTTAAAASLLDVAREQPELDLFLSRVLEALTHLATVPDARSLAETGGAYDALVRMLERPEVLAELRPRDPLAPARLRGLRLQQEILAAEGGTCSAQSLADALGMTRQAIDKRRKRGALIGLNLGRRGYAYPVWQIGLPGLEEMLAELRHLDPWTQAAYMLAPNRWLDGATPLHALHAGKREAVLAATRLYGEQVAA